jgi:hypothetical protein
LEELFDKELDSTRSRSPGLWNIQAEVNLLTAKLHFYSAMTVKQMKQIERPEDIAEINNSARFSYRSTLSHGLATSIRLIQLICNDLITANNLPSVAGSATPQSVTVLFNGLPKNYHRTLAFSAFFLIKYFALDPTCSPDDRDLARNHVLMAHSHFASFSSDPLEESSRVAAVIEALSRCPPSPSRGPYAIRTSDRLGASIYYDTVSTASEVRNLPVHVASEDELLESGISNPDYEAQNTMNRTAHTPTADTWVWNTDLPETDWNDLDLGTLIDPGELFVDFSQGSHAS